MDTTAIVILVLFLMALGIFIGFQMNDGGVTGNVAQFNSYPSQVSGGGCGR